MQSGLMERRRLNELEGNTNRRRSSRAEQGMRKWNEFLKVKWGLCESSQTGTLQVDFNDFRA
jgi:hypothetical protein